MARVIAMASAALIAVACGDSPTGAYFGATDPIFQRHSAAVVEAEREMSGVAETTGADGIAFGGRARSAGRLLPIFIKAAKSIEGHIVEWDAVDVPFVTGDYHALVRQAMLLRLDAMRHGAGVLEAVANGSGGTGSLVDAELAMAEANRNVELAREEYRRIRG